MPFWTIFWGWLQRGFEYSGDHNIGLVWYSNHPISGHPNTGFIRKPDFLCPVFRPCLKTGPVFKWSNRSGFIMVHLYMVIRKPDRSEHIETLFVQMASLYGATTSLYGPTIQKPDHSTSGLVRFLDGYCIVLLNTFWLRKIGRIWITAISTSSIQGTNMDPVLGLYVI